MANQTILRTGLVGCGWHGKALAEAIVRTPWLRLVACADPDESAASGAALLASDAVTYPSIETLLAEFEVDAIVVATPHHRLSPIVLLALRARKHVLVEKPIALNEAEAAAMETAAGEAGVCLMAGYSMRFSMGRRVRDLLDAGVVGAVRAVTGSICVSPMNNGWLANPEAGGGPLLYIGCHLVDMALWFLAEEPVEVFAHTVYRGDTGADDTAAFQIRFAKGLVAQCFVTQGADAFSFEITIHGSIGKVALRGRNFLQFEIEVSSSAVAAYGEPTIIRPLDAEHRDFITREIAIGLGAKGTVQRDNITMMSEPTIIRPLVQRDNITMMLVPELQEFAAAIMEKRSPSVTIADGRRVLRVLDAVIKSGQSHQPVALSG